MQSVQHTSGQLRGGGLVQGGGGGGSNNNSSSPPASTIPEANLFVSNMAPTVDSLSLQTAFAAFGAVLSCKVLDETYCLPVSTVCLTQLTCCLNCLPPPLPENSTQRF